MPSRLRRATAADAAAIRGMVRIAQLNPFGIAWQRFLVIEQDTQIVAMGQIKPHRNGANELASIAVAPSYQRRGYARVIIAALMASAPGPLYLTCEATMETFYNRFGFWRLELADMEPGTRRFAWFANTMMQTLRRPERVAFMVNGPTPIGRT